jgi:hypothetical protein
MAEQLTNYFLTLVERVIDVHAPFQHKVRRVRAHLPWWNSKIMIQKRLLRRCERMWRSSKLEADRQLFSTVKRTYHILLRKTRLEFLSYGLSLSGSDPRKVWLCLNKALGRHVNNPLPKYESDAQLALQFNEFFINKTADLYRCMASAQHDITLSVHPYKTTLSAFQIVNTRNVREFIMKSPRKSCSIDVLPTRLLIDHLDVLIDSITIIINRILMDGMPTVFKASVITPLLKKSTLPPDVLSNYRPVNNLTFMSKIAERIVSKQLINHLENNNLLDPNQSAYRQNYSCETVLVSICDTALRAIDEGDMMLLVLLDLSSAFYTVEHVRLLHKLE